MDIDALLIVFTVKVALVPRTRHPKAVCQATSATPWSSGHYPLRVVDSTDALAGSHCVSPVLTTES